MKHVDNQPHLFTHFLKLCLNPENQLNNHRIVDLMIRHPDLLDLGILLPLIPGNWSLVLLSPLFEAYFRQTDSRIRYTHLNHALSKSRHTKVLIFLTD